MNRTLQQVITDILIHKDCVVEHKEDGMLEVLAPPEVTGVLNIPEFSQLRFEYSDTTDGEIYASYDSDFFTSVAKLLDGKGKLSLGNHESSLPNEKKLTKAVAEKIKFNNATFRLDKIEEKNITYLLCYFKYVALSDERREGILPIIINEMTLSAAPYKQEDIEVNETVKQLKDVKRHDTKKVLLAAYSVSTAIVKEKLKDFIKSLERRLNRDIKRVYEYYETLKKETENTIKKKEALAAELGHTFINNIENKFGESSETHTIEKHIKEKIIKPEGIDKLYNKLNAIETERKWKVQDIVAKCALNIRIEPVAAIRIETQTLLAWINIKRRLASRQFPVCFNPITRQVEALPCESCHKPQVPYYVCDDKLHIICANCYTACSDCKKQYCKACRDACPKCKKARGNVIIE